MPGADSGKTAAYRRFCADQPVYFLVEVSSETVIADAGSPQDASGTGESVFRCNVHNHDLPCSAESNPVFVSP